MKKDKTASEWTGGSSEGAEGRPINPVPAVTFDYYDKQLWTIGVVQSGRTERTRVFRRLDFWVTFAPKGPLCGIKTKVTMHSIKSGYRKLKSIFD